VAPDISDVPIM
jgi:hypothetical protein